MKQIASRFILLLSCASFISGCDSEGYLDPSEAKHFDPIDREANLTREDFLKMRDMDSVKKTPEVTANLSNVVEPPIPDLAEILAAPPKPKIGETQLVSLAVTDDVPLKDVLLEVARLAKVDIDVDAGIKGGISMRATDKPFNEVIERIADMAGLRYNMKNGVLRIERDTPYIQVYTLDLLNSERSASGSISVGGGTTASSSTGSSGSSVGANTASGSSANITAKTNSDFWTKFESSIEQILTYSPAQHTSAATVSAQPVPPVASPEAPAPKKTTATSPDLKPMQASSAAVAPAAASASETTTETPAPAATAAATTKPANENGSFYIVNRQASTLTVSATQKQHELIQNFLKKIVENTSSQVLIEAKVVEVDLSDRYQSGINWTKFGTSSTNNVSPKGFNLTGDLNAVASTTADVTAPSISLIKNDILSSRMDLSAAVSLLNEFGTTRALSSPRLNAMNNQQAVLSFAEELRYFEVKIDTTDPIKDTLGVVTTAAKISVTSTPKTTPVGIVLNLQPSISSDTQEVTISVRPTITRLVKFIADPGFEISKANAIAALSTSNAPTSTITTLSGTHSDFPQLETRELDSIVKIKSGQTLVIGGLLEDKIINTDAGIPYASEIPLFGNLFKSVSKTNSKKELVIFIRATIIGTNGSADPYDKAVYDKFIKDPRPLKF